MANAKFERAVQAAQPLASLNILERIQSKIEEKMTRADTSNGGLANHQSGLAWQQQQRNNFLSERGKKSTTTISGTRRCPNLQKLVDKKR